MGREVLYHINGKSIVILAKVVKNCPESGQEAIPLTAMRAIQNILNGIEVTMDAIQSPASKASSVLKF